MLRALLIALVLANLAVWAWRQPAVAHALGLPGPDSQRDPDRLNRQINPQAVRVLRGNAAAPTPSASAAPAAVPASAASAAVNTACLQAGPLSDTALAPCPRGRVNQNLQGLAHAALQTLDRDLLSHLHETRTSAFALLGGQHARQFIGGRPLHWAVGETSSAINLRLL